MKYYVGLPYHGGQIQIFAYSGVPTPEETGYAFVSEAFDTSDEARNHAASVSDWVFQRPNPPFRKAVSE